MPQDNTKKSFPMLPGAHWWSLRERFKQSIPGVVTDSYLAATLNMQPKSARANVLPYLRDIGLTDAEGKTQQELAKAWRDDHQYPDVCRQIRELVYPDDLLSAAPDPSGDRQAAERWFANRTGAGAPAVRRMVQFYAILVDANVDKKPGQKAKTAKQVKPGVSQQPKKDKRAPKGSPRRTTPNQEDASNAPRTPGVSINLEIHISSDATPDQIDKIFESMAKHIYSK